MQPILVLGIGNILLRDEGVGVRVVEAMRELPLPDDVELVDGGTSGADLVDLIADRRRLIVVDAIDAGSPPGSVFRLRPQDLVPEAGDSISLHQIGVVESLHIAGQLGCLPGETVILGIQPGAIEPGLTLTDALAAAVPRAVEAILAEVRRARGD